MDETTATFRKFFEDLLLEAETKVEYYRRMLGKPLVESNAVCAKEIETLKSRLQEKTEELDNIKRYLNSNEGTLVQLQNKLLKCPVSGEVTVKLKGNYHTFFKKKISHPDGTEDNQKDCSKDSSLKSKYDLLETRCNALQEMNKRLLHRAAQEKDENEVLHRKVNDLMLKLSQAYRKRDELAEKLRKAESEPEIFSTFNVHLMSGESAKITELNKKMAELQKKNDELIEQLKNKAILNSVLAQKYEKLQIALNSDIGEVFECELDGRPFEKGYYLRLSKKDYELTQSDRASIHVVS